ncbi:putative acetyltransferase [Streptomyces sp. Tu6071]|nr:putative acetyltransferase [Streptomyces sp. Tu6071]
MDVRGQTAYALVREPFPQGPCRRLRESASLPGGAHDPRHLRLLAARHRRLHVAGESAAFLHPHKEVDPRDTRLARTGELPRVAALQLGGARRLPAREPVQGRIGEHGGHRRGVPDGERDEREGRGSGGAHGRILHFSAIWATPGFPWTRGGTRLSRSTTNPSPRG